MRAPARGAFPQPLGDFAEGPLSDIVSVTLTGGIIAGIGWSLLPLLSGRAQVPQPPAVASLLIAPFAPLMTQTRHVVNVSVGI